MNALRVLVQAKDEGPLSAAVIAERARVPAKFLEAILLDLSRAGIIGSRKGRGGGHVMRKAPEEVNMAELVRLLDGAIALVPCVSLNYYRSCEECIDERTCGFRDVFLDIRKHTVALLMDTSLSDVLDRERRLARRSSIRN